MQINDPCVKAVLRVLSEALELRTPVGFNDVTSSKRCKKFTVKEIGQALEFLRRNGYVSASSRFGCSELLAFSATALTEKGRESLKDF